ncbi:hypothetical protein HHK36_009319 [Tetracentron sinense]|uniref:BZIP domain-containing protein n=1 Tax=Tetracentron sinense TaxID=13715 RepID=A0A835DLI4_TETSI|nr:hypothetical protein HHK36_009319 [Tetracentron sinense]
MVSLNSANSDLPLNSSINSLTITELQSDQSKNPSSMNMDELLRNVYGGNSAAEIIPDAVAVSVAGGGEPQYYKEEAFEGMTLEDFLSKAGAISEDDAKISPTAGPGNGVFGVDWMVSNQFQQQQQEEIDGSIRGFGNGLGRGGRGKRRAVQEPVDKVAQQRQRRMIKNRESASRSRERKHAYTQSLELSVAKLEEENARLVREQVEWTKERFKKNAWPLALEATPGDNFVMVSRQFGCYQQVFALACVVEWRSPYRGVRTGGFGSDSRCTGLVGDSSAHVATSNAPSMVPPRDDVEFLHREVAALGSAICFLKSKSDVYASFKAFHKMVCTQFDAKFKILRSENGGEYPSGHFLVLTIFMVENALSVVVVETERDLEVHLAHNVATDISAATASIQEEPSAGGNPEEQTQLSTLMAAIESHEAAMERMEEENQGGRDKIASRRRTTRSRMRVYKISIYSSSWELEAKKEESLTALGRDIVGSPFLSSSMSRRCVSTRSSFVQHPLVIRCQERVQPLDNRLVLPLLLAQGLNLTWQLDHLPSFCLELGLELQALLKRTGNLLLRGPHSHLMVLVGPPQLILELGESKGEAKKTPFTPQPQRSPIPRS